ncbi:MAG: HAMP domain-containing sensor histidine kinase [bacterium]|nr:HAMP domain-containing sensor histidine kinase [bacterium]
MINFSEKISPHLGPPLGEDKIITGFRFDELGEAGLSADQIENINEIADTMIEEGKKGKPFVLTANLYTQKITVMTKAEREYFDRIFLSKVLRALLEAKQNLLSFKDLSDADFESDKIKEAENKFRVIQNLINFARFVSRLTGQVRPLAKMIANTAHDQNNSLVVVQYLDLYANAETDRVRDQHKAIIEKSMDRTVAFLGQIYEANLAIVEGDFSKEKYALKHSLEATLERLRLNSGYEVVDGKEAKVGNISVNINPNLVVNAQASGIAVMILNLLKNPATLYRNQKFPIVMECYPVDPDCIEISVRDHGQGINITELRKSLAQAAIVKRYASKELSPFEETLLDPAWTSYLPEAALTRHLFSRGTSLRGSSGIGLAIAKTIVDGHDGDIRIANHPEGGAEVKILLPNTEETDRIKRYQLVHKALLKRLGA